MKKALIIGLLSINIMTIMSDELDFKTSYLLALKNSNYIKTLEESLELDKINKLGVNQPGAIGFSLNLTPTVNYLGDGNVEPSIGTMGLSISPLKDVLVSGNHTFNDSTTASISYALFKSSRDKDLITNKYEIQKQFVKESKREFLTEFKKSYIELIYYRKLQKLEISDLELTKRELVIRQTRVESGIESRYDYQEAQQKLMNREIEILNNEISLLKLEMSFQSKVGLDLSSTTLLPIKLPELDEITRYSQEELLKDFKSSAEYLNLKERIRDQKAGVKDAYRDMFPEVTIGTSITTEEFSQFTGALTLDINFTNLLSDSNKIETEKILLSQAERTLKEKITSFYNEMEYKKREDIIRIKQIKLLYFNLKKADESLKINKFKYESGEILKETLERDILNKERLKLEYDKTLGLYIIEAMKVSESI